jgi:hypothetical protein
MKKVLLIIGMAAMMAACDGAKNQNSGMNSEDNVEENSGEAISPQLEDSAGRMEVDTVSSPSDAQRQATDSIQ